ncbi:hypothetical protein OUZ56_010452 [Daphnia magna]|uniref:Secreted protein n=1 Tax=Daphnia magna TaxID=35525 RepID=A0ABR0AJ11_9CRUS|nr:hypothetical protein OUZ56_010452 [Daphnia magna]
MIAVNNDYFNVLYIILVLERCHGGCTAAMNRENTCIFTFSFSAELEHIYVINGYDKDALRSNTQASDLISM